MKAIKELTHEHYFAYCVDYTVYIDGHITGAHVDEMWHHFDHMYTIDIDTEESITLLLTMIDNALCENDYNGVYVAAKRIKEILRDCGIK